MGVDEILKEFHRDGDPDVGVERFNITGDEPALTRVVMGPQAREKLLGTGADDVEMAGNRVQLVSEPGSKRGKKIGVACADGA